MAGGLQLAQSTFRTGQSNPDGILAEKDHGQDGRITPKIEVQGHRVNLGLRPGHLSLPAPVEGMPPDHFTFDKFLERPNGGIITAINCQTGPALMRLDVSVVHYPAVRCASMSRERVLKLCQARQLQIVDPVC